MFSSFKLQLIAGASVMILVASFMTYLHIGMLKKDNKLLEAENQSYEMVIDSYAQNAEISRKIQEKTDE